MTLSVSMPEAISSPKGPASGRWTAILQPSDPLTAPAREAVDAISDAILKRDYPPMSRLSRPHRNYEDPLLFGYLALTHNDLTWSGHAADHLNAAGSQTESLRYNPGLYGGLCGLGWVIEHLSRRLAEIPGQCDDSDGAAAEDPNEEIDAELLRQVKSRDWQGMYDLIGGLVGIGTYFLERLPAESALRGVCAVVAALEAIAGPADGGIAWYTAPRFLPAWQRELYPDGYYNLGVAHGIPGILHFLGEVCVLGIEEERARPLLEGGMAWLMAQERPAGSLSRFGSWTSRGVSTESRLTWCYGDLGVMAVLLQVARRSGREDWMRYAHGLLDHCLNWPMARSGISDAAICHGAAGAAHAFNRIYQTEGDPRCRDAASIWLERVLEMRKPGQGVGGYLALTRPDPRSEEIWEPSPAFLDGAGGIALTLLAALTPVEPEWDRLLLLSGR